MNHEYVVRTAQLSDSGSGWATVLLKFPAWEGLTASTMFLGNPIDGLARLRVQA